MDTEERQHWLKILEIKGKRLRVFEEQSALLGSHADPSLIIQYNDLHDEITNICNHLGIDASKYTYANFSSKKARGGLKSSKNFAFKLPWKTRGILGSITGIFSWLIDTLLLPLVKGKYAWQYTIWFYQRFNKLKSTWSDFGEWILEIGSFTVATYICVQIYFVTETTLNNLILPYGYSFISIAAAALLFCLTFRIFYYIEEGIINYLNNA